MNNATLYQFRIKGHLDDSLAEWFEGLTITHLADGDSLLTGSIQDQAALHGILKRISSLGLSLISVNALPDAD
jgi:hypothetical protein